MAPENPTSGHRPTYAIGDIHGCPGMLAALLRSIRADAAVHGEVAKPRIVLLGDLVDRGPDSKGVLDILVSDGFRNSFDGTIIRGNHDDWLLEALKRPLHADAWLRNGGAETIESYGIEFGGNSTDKVVQRFVATFPRTHRKLLEDTSFSLVEGNLMFVHGGVEPGIPLSRQSPSTMMWIKDEFTRFEGTFDKMIVHGHTTTESRTVEVHHNRISVDTGCGFPGGKLSAAVLVSGQLDRVLTVGPASPKHLDIPAAAMHRAKSST